jgi:hypothetical protein
MAQALERGALAPATSPAHPIEASPRPGWEAAASAAPRPAVAPPARPAPFIDGHFSMRTEIPIASGSASPDSTSAALAYDKNLNTVWQTTADVPQTSAFAIFDLNMARQIGEIAWQFSEPSDGAPLRIEAAVQPSNWQTIGTPGNAPANAWQSLVCDVSARYIRFYFENPNHLPTLGHLREVQIFGK